MKPGPAVLKKTTLKASAVATEPTISAAFDEPTAVPPGQSRILGPGGSALVEGPNMKAEDDDGEGWITSTRHMGVLKSQAGGGPLDPIKVGSAILPDVAASVLKGPLTDQRTACTTTDFAMQNVLLQMGLILLSVDGMQIRRLKSWVLRCGACFKIHTDPFDPTTGMRRMFCAHCGSDRVQRVSASVDGKTGRLKLYFSKRKRNKYMSTRGTKFSLPKPGTGNRFQGDLLLREDQLLMGAWQQKVKKNMGGQSRAHAESIFGKDIASNVGCGVTSMPNEIQVGFGRRNPNAAKGRERRGKKKKSSDRACGLRRY
jgi:RNA-binding protein NOB1